ncbi:MAG: putative metal-binding motif-containing protein [Candidatus Peribacteria bacterium]|nr:MAG: putative metal-binding motif-containing protein [Candidatus Peribacteria bacterium]
MYPGNAEVCDGLDNDCTNGIDDGVLLTFYADTDGDAYGDVGSTTLACSAPVGYTGDNTDCDDGDSNNYPGNTEVCDMSDNDCDSLVDDADPGIFGQSIFYADTDGDGQGDGSLT